MNKKKLATSVAAVATAAALLLGGTFAWQSVNQTALNEGADTINPGGRLHDDFDGTNKDVYVENFTDPENGGQDIFARVRLEEYLEVVLNYGTPGQTEKQLLGSKYYAPVLDEDGEQVVDEDGNLVYETAYTYEYVPFTEYSNSGEADAGVEVGADGSETSYWKWKLGGSTVYMPTFNMNKDSLAADVNGEYKYGVGVITDKNIEGGQYSPMVTYTEGNPKTANEIWDTDSNDIDELEDVDISALIEQDGTTYDSKAVKLVNKEHTAKSTLDAKLISMSDWLTMVEDEGEYDPTAHGNYWVYDDTDENGWVYWSAPIAPGTATGLLLDGIALNQVMDDTWYYAINVVAQFVTADDAGAGDGTGFYDETKGEAPSWEAEQLLEAIGVTLDGSEDDDGEVFYSTIVLEHDGDSDTMRGGEFLLFTATVYDENGDEIAYTEDVTFSVKEVTDSEAAMMALFDATTMDGNALFVAEDVVTRGVSNIVVTATYTDENGNEYEDIYELMVQPGESPLTIGLTINGRETTPMPGTDDYQFFMANPAEKEFKFSTKLNEVPANATWSIEPDEYWYTIETIDGVCYAKAIVADGENNRYDWAPDGITPVANGDTVAQIDTATGEFTILLRETFPYSMHFTVTAEYEEDGETYHNSSDVFIGRVVANFLMYNGDEELNSVASHSAKYTAGENSVINLAFSLTVNETDAEIDVNKLQSWELYEGENEVEGELIDKSLYSVTVNRDTKTAMLTIPADSNITAENLCLSVEYNHGVKAPRTPEGISGASLSIIESSVASDADEVSDVEIIDVETGEASATYTPGTYQKIKLEAYPRTENGGYVGRGTVTWAIANIADMQGVQLVQKGFSAEVWLLKAEVDEIVVSALYSKPDETSVTASGNFTITAEEGPDETAPTVSFVTDYPRPHTVTISNLNDMDFPLSVSAYQQTDGEGTIAETPYSTFSLTLTGEVVTSDNEWATDFEYAGEELSFSYSALADGLFSYESSDGGTRDFFGMKLEVLDVNGNRGEYIKSWTGGGCFVAGTQVQTVDGLVNIEDIKLGDMVYSIDLTTGAKVVSPVTWVQGTRYIDATYAIYAGGEKVVATYEHPFYVVDKEWVAAEDLTVGDKIKTVDGQVTITKIVYTELDAPVQVYNFTVDGTHNYLISAAGLLVHNIAEK